MGGGFCGSPVHQGALARARFPGHHKYLRSLSRRGGEEPGHPGQLPLPTRDLRYGRDFGRGVHKWVLVSVVRFDG
ncbi:hypothetical protein GCM10011579_082120 [Streptomyces albiflavescens]|uniref:Uncharacterized protein n=1 Tax=Streptomyces albiflavescens TaxID=1623582 RepID=A0A917YDY1_9ACTN|nr:hypothetical protein GCM10011579_082120 [Streptomyces albiflavescens]